MGKLKSFAEWRLQESLIEYNFYFEKFKKLLLVMFKWGNFPDGINSRYLEEQLLYNGKVIFFKSKKLGFYVVCKGVEVGLNNYNEPVGFHCVSDDGSINEYVKANECVVIYNDITRKGNVANINFFAKKISNVVKTIDVNLENMKQPFIIATSEGQEQSVREVLKKKSNGEPYILVTDDFAKNNTQVFNLDVKDYTTSLTNLKNEYINEALTFFGINNVNILKKERLITSEAEQNNEQIDLSKSSMLDMRIKAVNEIKEKFNIDINLIVDVEEIKKGVDDIE